jgi:spore cortex formation protein SpoVR/YcgB (stage V sporulation)
LRGALRLRSGGADARRAARLADQGLDKYKRPSKLDTRKERAEQAKRLSVAQETMRRPSTTAWCRKRPRRPAAEVFPANPEENLLYFIEKHAPKLEPWQRELARIVRKIAQYFYPQRQTQVMNEGWATFWHHRLIYDMYDAGQIDQGILLECLHSHTNVVRQREYSGLNPYALGFAAWNEIKRVCENPTAMRTGNILPDIAGKDWLETFHDVMQNYRDESFLLQFLTPKLVRDFKLMNIQTLEGLDHWTVDHTAGSGRLQIHSQSPLGRLPPGVGDAGDFGGALRARHRPQTDAAASKLQRPDAGVSKSSGVEQTLKHGFGAGCGASM